ncbi:hypothetical protein [Streptomyces sp. NPDC047939]|uniref:hypothetical protein n=1 Tax=Streptomyces sp. NPDC047939 TaxID=3155381 RepID=UPI00343859D4
MIDADRIVVMEGGRIVRQGTHEQRLAETDGPFARPAGPQLTAPVWAKRTG